MTVSHQSISYVLTRVYGGNMVCTYVYNHKNPTAASSATVNCRMNMVTSCADLESIDRLEMIFSPRDLDCVSGGALVSITSIWEIIASGMDPDEMLVAVNNLYSEVARNEDRKNDLIEQILLNKLGKDFL